MTNAAGTSPSVDSLLKGATVALRRMYDFAGTTAVPTSTPDGTPPTADGYKTGLCQRVSLWVLPTTEMSIEVYRFNWINERWTLCSTRTGLAAGVQDEIQIQTGRFIQRIYVRCTGGTGQVWGARSSDGGVK